MKDGHDDAVLWDLEERFWTSGLDSARTSMAKDAVMILPYPAGILQGDQLWNHLKRSSGWRSVKMSEKSARHRGDLAILSYHVSAEKADVPVYEALCASTYLHDDEKWTRISHQQTPVA